MKKIFTCFLTIAAVLCKAQCAGGWLDNSNSATGSFKALCNDSQGNVLAAVNIGGGAFQYQSVNYNSIGNPDIVVMKLGSNNAVLWSHHFYAPSGVTEAYIESIVCDDADNVYIAGYFKGSLAIGGYTLTNTGVESGYIAKLSGSNGNTLWAENSTSSASNSYFNSIAWGDNTLYATGFFDNNCSFGGSSITSAGNRDIMLFKLDAAGTVIDAESYGGTADDQGKCVKVMPGGDVVLGASYASNFMMNSLIVNTNGFHDVLFARIDKNTLSAKWVMQAGSSMDDYAADVDVDTSGNIYGLLGFMQNITVGATTEISAGDKDVGVFKIDSSATVKWFNRFGGPGVEYAGRLRFTGNSIAVSASCDGMVTFTGGLGLANPSVHMLNPLLARFDLNGNYLGHLLGNDANNSSNPFFYGGWHSLSADSNHNIYWSDSFLNQVDFLSMSTSLPTSNNQQSADFLLKVCDVTVDVKEAHGNEAAKAYPNPGHGICTVLFAEPIKTLLLCDALGRPVEIAVLLNVNQAEIITAGLAAGVYVAEVRLASGKINRQKLIVE